MPLNRNCRMLDILMRGSSGLNALMAPVGKFDRKKTRSRPRTDVNYRPTVDADDQSIESIVIARFTCA